MVIIGAGCAGLACARALADSGETPVVLDKGRGVGGRAATRRIDGQPVDHGLIFYHGSHPSFLDALDRVAPMAPPKTWPELVVGDGKPCLPRAFTGGERRVAFVEGVTAFPKSLAHDLDIRLRARVGSVTVRESHFELDVETEAGDERIDTDRLVLTLPAEQMRELVESLPASRELDSIRALTRGLATAPCLTLIAGYPLTTSVPDWDVLYPSDSDVLLLASHDSRKRIAKTFHAFVFQCDGLFSRRHQDDEAEAWIGHVLREAARLLGPWAAEPSLTQTHRWRYGRANTLPLARPLVARFPGGHTLGLAGELFDAALGVEGAYLSGVALAKRLLSE